MSGIGQKHTSGITPGLSRMQVMQAQFQQKQMQEKEAKLLQMLDNQQQKLIQHTNGFISKYNNNVSSAPTNSASSNGSISPTVVPPGKVRQMFEERRKGGSQLNSASSTVKGIDKSYPLDPIVAPPTNRSKPPSNTSVKSRSSEPPPLRKNTAAPALPIQRPSNLGSSSKPITPPTSSGGPPLSVSSGSSGVTAAHLQRTSPGGGTRPSPVSTRTSPLQSKVSSPLKSPSLSAGSSINSSKSASPTGVNYPPVANTTKYSDYASQLERREASLSQKLRSIELNDNESAAPAPSPPARAMASKKAPPAKASVPPISPAKVPASISRTLRTTAPPSSPQKKVVAKSSKKAPPRPKGSPPPGLDECPMCGRYFAPDRIKKHEAICKKVGTKKRKVFDPTKMRMQGTEAEPYIRIVSAKGPPKAQPPQNQKKKADWRKKHEEFIATIRAAKEYQNHVAKGGDPNDLPPPPPSDNSDYIQCPHCLRKFSEGAAERHIPKCKNIKSNKAR